MYALLTVVQGASKEQLFRVEAWSCLGGSPGIQPE